MGLASLRRDRSAERSHPLQHFNALLGANHHAVTSREVRSLGRPWDNSEPQQGIFLFLQKRRLISLDSLPQKDDLLKGKGNCHLSLLQKLKFGLARQNKSCLSFTAH